MHNFRTYYIWIFKMQTAHRDNTKFEKSKQRKFSVCSDLAFPKVPKGAQNPRTRPCPNSSGVSPFARPICSFPLGTGPGRDDHNRIRLHDKQQLPTFPV